MWGCQSRVEKCFSLALKVSWRRRPRLLKLFSSFKFIWQWKEIFFVFYLPIVAPIGKTKCNLSNTSNCSVWKSGFLFQTTLSKHLQVVRASFERTSNVDNLWPVHSQDYFVLRWGLLTVGSLVGCRHRAFSLECRGRLTLQYQRKSLQWLMTQM